MTETWNEMISLKVLEATYHPHHYFASDLLPVFCQKHNSFLCLGQEGYQITATMSAVAVSDVSSWNRTSVPPTES